MTMRILIVDDDTHIRELVRQNLRWEGFEVLEAGDGLEALSLLQGIEIDLAVLDVMMPNMDGWDLCRQLRQDYPDLPLLMVTAKGETSQKVKGFQLGADDYMVKPFDPVELVMRVKVLLKRYRISAVQKVQLGDVTMDRGSLELRQGDHRETLPLKEFELLFKLASNPGKIFTRNQLIENIWGRDYEGDERTVDVHIKRLRERFVGENEVLSIVTIRGLGYKLEVKA